MSGGCGAGCSCGSQVAVQAKLKQLLDNWEAQCVEHLPQSKKWKEVLDKWGNSVNNQDIQDSLGPFLDDACTRGQLCQSLWTKLRTTDWNSPSNPLNDEVRRMLGYVKDANPWPVHVPGETTKQRRWTWVRLKNKKKCGNLVHARAVLHTPLNSPLGDAQVLLADAQEENATLRAALHAAREEAVGQV